jgi:predicted nuclease of predicted toxin-antitoxin system
MLTQPKTKEGVRELNRLTSRRSRFLVDESLGTGVAEVLRYLRYNAKFGPDVGLKGKADPTVYAYAWREKRILLTHDKDYLNDREYPFNRNPGVIVLPGEEGERVPLRMAIRSMLNIFARSGRAGNRRWESLPLRSMCNTSGTGKCNSSLAQK